MYTIATTNVPRFDKRIVHYPEEMQTAPIYRSIDSYYILINEIESPVVSTAIYNEFPNFSDDSIATTDMFRSSISREELHAFRR